VREAFVAPPGSLIASADYSQIELRIMAHLSGDEALLRPFTDGMDVHRATAAEVFGLEPEQVSSSEQRRYAKVINFGLIYGMSAYGLAKPWHRQQGGQKLHRPLFPALSGRQALHGRDQADLAKARATWRRCSAGACTCPRSTRPMARGAAAPSAQAINAPMQGTAADLIKLSMVKVQQVLDAQRRGTKMIMQVHDELVFEVPEARWTGCAIEIPRLMAGVANSRCRCWPRWAWCQLGPRRIDLPRSACRQDRFAGRAGAVRNLWCARIHRRHDAPLRQGRLSGHRPRVVRATG
jgi:DNA polymerase-1